MVMSRAGGCPQLSIVDAGVGCGEIPITCSNPPQVTITGLGGELPTSFLNAIVLPPGQNDLGAPFWSELTRGLLSGVLVKGFRLHFTGFSASALLIDSTGTIRMTGFPNNNCSHAPLPPPAPAPLRGISRVNTTVGKGEVVFSRGSVMPFDLIPEVKVDWINASDQLSQAYPAEFLPWTPAIGSRTFGDELMRFLEQPKLGGGIVRVPRGLPGQFAVSVELIRVPTSSCLVKPTRPRPAVQFP